MLGLTFAQYLHEWVAPWKENHLEQRLSSRSRHYFRLKGETAEAFVHDLALHTFLVDWCYPNPELPNEEELCDLLVVFDKTAVVWQVKNLKLKKDGSLNESGAEKNLRQLSGARRQLFELATPVELSNPRRTLEVFDPTMIEEVFLVSVLLGGIPDVVALPTSIGGHPCHVFTKETTEIILNELDTVLDFCAYLREKERVQETLDSLVLVGGEKELLAYYLMHERSLAELEEHNLALLDAGFWNDLQRRPEYQAKKKADEISYGWDDLISQVHRGGSPQYERIARELARLGRFERRCLSQSFYDAHVIAHQRAGNRAVFRRVTSRKHVTFCFLFADETIMRDERRAILGDFCFVARGQFGNQPLVIGIATEMVMRPMCSYDFCLLEIPEWTEEHQRQMVELQGATGILTRATEHHADMVEYPEVRDGTQ